MILGGIPEAESTAVEVAVDGVEPDRRLVWQVEHDHLAAATEMRNCLFALGCEFFRIAHEPATSQLVAEGWYKTPAIQARYRPPSLADRPGLAADLTEKDRERLRKIVRRTHRAYFRDEPSTRLLDSLIDGLGPETAARMVKQHVDSGAVD